MFESIFNKIILPTIDEKISAFRVRQNFEDANSLLSDREVPQYQKGISTIHNLIKNNALSIQEAIDAVAISLRKHISLDQSYDKSFNPAVKTALLFLSSLPKKDINDRPYNIELPYIRLEDITLHCMNFSHFVLYDSVFSKTDFSRTSFRNCDLGGCQFINKSSVEWCDFEGAKLNRSFLSENTSSFIETLLWGSNLEKADIAKCLIQDIDGTDMKKVYETHKDSVEFLS